MRTNVVIFLSQQFGHRTSRFYHVYDYPVDKRNIETNSLFHPRLYISSYSTAHIYFSTAQLLLALFPMIQVRTDRRGH